MPIDLPAVIGTFMGTLIVLIPVAGLTARFALKPIVETMAKLRESSNKGETVALIERRLALLEQEVQHIGGIREDVARLVEELEFQRKLAAPSESKPRG